MVPKYRSCAKDALVFGLGISVVCLVAIISWRKTELYGGTEPPHPRNPHDPPSINSKFNQRPWYTNYWHIPYNFAWSKPMATQSQRQHLLHLPSQWDVKNHPNCTRYFHVNCIDQWLKLDATCPVCRDKFEEPPPVAS